VKDIKDQISLLYSTEGDLLQNQIRVLENLQATGRKDSVVALAPLLDRKSALTGYVRKTIVGLIKHFNARDFLALEVRVRESLWSHGWSYQPVHALETDTVPDDDALLLYGVYSMHKSGYVREKAVRALSQYGSSKALPFLLLRLNDWVPPVRHLASVVLESILSHCCPVELISNLPLVDHIKVYGRTDKDHLLSQIESRICEEASYEELAEGMKNPIREVRRALMKLLPQRDQNLILALEALDDPDPIVRSLAFQKVATHKNTAHEIIRGLCRSKYSDQRRLAYMHVVSRADRDSKEILIEGLLDRSSSVRDICQYFLAKKYQYDPSRYYDEKLPHPVAILGLGEVDPKASASKILALLEGHAEPRIVCATLVSLGKVDPDSYWEIFVAKAASENLSIAVQALRQLSRCGRLTPDLLLDLHSKNDEATRRVLIRLARRFSKWKALSTLLHLYVHEESQRNKQMIVDFLSMHLERKKTVFTSPNRFESQAIRSNLPLIDRLPAHLKEEILLDLREFEKEQ
jgi:HEAT repeat protein